jgi:hypothetical protein
MGRTTKSPDVVSTLGDGGALAKASTMDMLRAEKASRKDMGAVVAVTTAALVDSLSSLDATDAGAAAVLAHSAIRKSHGELERGLELAVTAAAVRARETAAAHASAQLAEANRVLRAYEIPTGSIATLAVAEDAIDAARAASVSRSIGSRWLMSITSRIKAWQSSGGSLPQTARDASKSIAPQLDRAAATETAVAYAEEHERHLDHAMEQAKASPLHRLLHKRWEGVLDRKICRVCANHDNEVVPANEPFRGGAVPGEVHPNCRCQSVAAITSTDLNLAHAVTREVAGPGLGRAAVGGASTRNAFEDWDKWPPETKQAWFRLMGQAKSDPDVRARLLTPEIRRHLETVKAGVDRHAPVVPRLRKTNPRRTGLRTDARTPRAIHEEYLGRAIGAPAARFEFGELVPTAP